jgi:hypothetical protein
VKRRVVILGVCALFCSVAVAGRPGSYLCATDMSTGFRLDKGTGQWRIANFKPERKYIVTQSSTDALVWDVRPIGSASAIARCKSNPDFNPQALRCSGHEEFWIDRKSVKFLEVYPHGYWDTGQESAPGILPTGDPDTPLIEIGTCSPL